MGTPRITSPDDVEDMSLAEGVSFRKLGLFFYFSVKKENSGMMPLIYNPSIQELSKRMRSSKSSSVQG